MEVVYFDFLLKYDILFSRVLDRRKYENRENKTKILIITTMNSNGNIFIVTNIEIGVLIKRPNIMSSM